MTDEEIVDLVQQGDKDKYDEIVKRYENKLFVYLKNLTNQPTEEIEDLLQEVFIKSYINLQSFDSKKKFSSWIYRIAHNQAVDFIKHKQFKKQIIDDNEEFIDNKEKLIEELEIEHEQERLIQSRITLLNLKYREVIILFYFENKSYEEISDILHIPVSHVGVLIFRARKELKNKLKSIINN